MKTTKSQLRRILKEVMGDTRGERDFFAAIKEYAINARNEFAREGYESADLEKHLQNRLQEIIKEYVKSSEWRRIVDDGY